jgi:site-specific recombinase XerD
MQAMTITHSPLGKKLRHSLTIPVPEAQSPSDQKLQQYIIASLSWKMSSLVPFVFNNTSTQELAKYLLRHRTASTGTLYQYVYGIYRFSQWINAQPDELIKSCQDLDGDPDPKALSKYSKLLDDFVGNLQAENLAPGTVSNHVKGVKALFRCNRLKLELPYSLSKRGVYSDRAPTPEELSRVIDIAELRQKVIVSMLALGGFRTGTLVKLQYRHVKRDLEKLLTPIHIHVEAEITKGKYHDYDTFIGQEAAEYLRAYLETRRQGTEKIPPENIHDETPLLRNQQCKRVLPLTPAAIHQLVHDLYVRAALVARALGFLCSVFEFYFVQ